MSPPPPGRILSPTLTFVAGFVLAIVLFAAAGFLFMGTHMGDGSMMGPGGTGEGVGANAAVIVLVALGFVALLLMFRARLATRQVPVSPAPVPSVPVVTPSPSPPPPPEPSTRLEPDDAEALALRLLDPDERLLFMEVRDRGGAALQKDLGHRDGFSRTKVTRVLDRLEAKGLVVREREGMTNRVRLLTRPTGST